jgi:hypothetical protein
MRFFTGSRPCPGTRTWFVHTRRTLFWSWWSFSASRWSSTTSAPVGGTVPDYGMAGVATVTLSLYALVRSWRFVRALMWPTS